jgi:hypothetical protein
MIAQEGAPPLARRPRLEWRSQDGQNKADQRDHYANLTDSLTSSTRIGFSVHTADAGIANNADPAATMIGPIISGFPAPALLTNKPESLAANAASRLKDSALRRKIDTIG